MIDDDRQWSEWMIQAQEGDEDSYRRLLTILGDVIEIYLRNRFGPLNFLEDIVQESLLAIHQARHTYTPERPFRPWLFAIVQHKAIDMLRRRNVRQDEGWAAREENRESLPESESFAESAEALLESEQLFEGLKPAFREALILTKVAGFSILEAAQRAGVSEAAMKVRVHRALKDLRDHLKLQ